MKEHKMSWLIEKIKEKKSNIQKYYRIIEENDPPKSRIFRIEHRYKFLRLWFNTKYYGTSLSFYSYEEARKYLLKYIKETSMQKPYEAIKHYYFTSTGELIDEQVKKFIHPF